MVLRAEIILAACITSSIVAIVLLSKAESIFFDRIVAELKKFPLNKLPIDERAGIVALVGIFYAILSYRLYCYYKELTRHPADRREASNVEQILYIIFVLICCSTLHILVLWLIDPEPTPRLSEHFYTFIDMWRAFAMFAIAYGYYHLRLAIKIMGFTIYHILKLADVCWNMIQDPSALIALTENIVLFLFGVLTVIGFIVHGFFH